MASARATSSAGVGIDPGEQAWLGATQLAETADTRRTIRVTRCKCFISSLTVELSRAEGVGLNEWLGPRRAACGAQFCPWCPQRLAASSTRRPIDTDVMVPDGVDVCLFESRQLSIFFQHSLTEHLVFGFRERQVVLLSMPLQLGNAIAKQWENNLPLTILQHRNHHVASPTVQITRHTGLTLELSGSRPRAVVRSKSTPGCPLE